MASSDALIAIVGIACRFSGDAIEPEKLWEMLIEGRNGWSQTLESRFASEGLYYSNREKVGSVWCFASPTLLMEPYALTSTLPPYQRQTYEEFTS